MNYREKIYSIAFDVLIETIVNHQKTNESINQLKEIAHKYDTFYNSVDFGNALENKLHLYKHQLINEDESLFIQDTHIPYVIKNQILISEKEKIEVFIIIQFWANEYKLGEPLIFFKLAKNLGIELSDSEIIHQFFYNKELIEKNNVFFKLYKEQGYNDEQLEGEWVESNKPDVNEEFEKDYVNNTNSFADVIFLSKFKLFLISVNNPELSIKTLPDNFCLIETGENIYVGEDYTIGFASLKKKLIEKKFDKKYYLTAFKAEFNYSNKKGVRAFNFFGEPGELIGIIGSEGSGKSTILKLLSGFEKPTKGDVCINGYNLSNFYYQLSGLIGYVGEEDILVPELTVFENLAMAVRLFLRNSNDYNIKILVKDVLSSIGLFELRNSIVGHTSEKKLHPGQRWLLNIAIELIREPLILIIDSPKFPLSMDDSSKILDILTKYTFNGKLVITSITQSNISSFENIDKILLLNHDGYPVYFGDRQNAVKSILASLPEGIVRLFSTNDNGHNAFLKILDHKFFDPIAQQDEHLNSTFQKIEKVRMQKKIPAKQYHSPRLEKQFFAYSTRNFKTKIARRRELIFTVIIAPFLAIFFSIIFRFSETKPYLFSMNPNIPVFFYLSIITTIFLGLMMSVNEIIKEKSTLEKEMYLNLSLFSYINSKVFYIFIIILVQTFLYTITANFILGIHGMVIYHWLIYFSSGAFGAILGLLFSSLCKNISSITLKVIPFVIVIFMIFGCGWILPSQLNITKNKYSPLVSDLMVNRWAYEAIVVKQFTDNPYQKNFNKVDEKISIGAYNSFNVLPLLKDLIEEQRTDSQLSDSSKHFLRVVSNRFKFMVSTEDIYPFEFTDSLSKGFFNEKIKEEATEYIIYLDYYYNNLYNEGLREKQNISDSLNNLIGENASENLRYQHFNQAIAQQVRNSSLRKNMKIVGDDIVQLTDPVFSRPINNYGRSQFFQRTKKFNNQMIDTYEFNLSVIWLFILLGYIFLITDIINRFIRGFTK